MSLATITQLVADKMRTVSLGREVGDPRVHERAIGQAVLQYGLDVPQKLTDDVVGVTGGLFDLPPDWDATSSALVAVEYPIGVAPMATLEAAVARSEGGAWQVMLLDDTLTDATVRVHYTGPHQVDADVCTVPAIHENAIACWAAAELCRQLATQKGHERDASISAVATTGGSQSGDLSRRARDWTTQYRVALGLADPEATAGSRAAGTVVAFGSTRMRGRFNSWVG